MATETLYATSLTSGTVATSANALGAPNGVYTTDVDQVSWTARFAMGNPVGTQANGTHTITARVRKETGTGTPVLVSISLYEGSTLISAIGAGNWNITSTSQQDVAATFNSSLLAGRNLSNIEVQLVTTGVGGSGSARTCVQLDSITWSGDVTTPAPTGTISSTLAGATMTGSGSESISGAAASTLGGATMSGVGVERMTGTLASTLAGATMAGSGSESISGTASPSLAGAGMSGVGEVGEPPIIGVLSSTLAGATMAGAGSESISGAAASTLAGATSSANGSVAISGLAASTLTGATMTGSGNETISGVISTPLAGAAMGATGAMIEPVVGSLSSTLAGVTMSGIGSYESEAPTGWVNVSLAGATMSGSGRQILLGSLSGTLEDATMYGNGTHEAPVIYGDIDATLGAVGLVGSGTVNIIISGIMSATLADATFNGVTHPYDPSPDWATIVIKSTRLTKVMKTKRVTRVPR